MKVKVAIISVFIYILSYSVLMGFILFTNLDLSERFQIPSYDLFNSQGNFVVLGYPMTHLILCFPLANIMFIGLISILIGTNIFMLMNKNGNRLQVRISFFLFLLGTCFTFFTNDGLCGYPFLYSIVSNISVTLSKNALLFMMVSSILLLSNLILNKFYFHKINS